MIDNTTPADQAEIERIAEIHCRAFCDHIGREYQGLSSYDLVPAKALFDAGYRIPSPQTQDDVREAVARLLAPGAWRYGDYFGEDSGDGAPWKRDINASLDRADSILAALSAIPKPRVSAEAVINAVSGSLGGSFSDALTDHIAEDVVARLRDAGIEVES